ncbi:MAG TPA: F0F1 ATP synthase subunit delta [Mycobacteriales bacterium]|nr:F0F1 ATP synthase subunit delta [Mycobacteriales bacterium]
MQAASRESLALARERLDSLVSGVAETDVDTLTLLGDQLADVVGLLAGQPGLRRALADPSAPEAARVALLDGLLAGRLADPAVRTVRELVAARWSRPDDLVDAVETLARLAALAVAERDGSIEDVEDELFRFGRILDGQPRLCRMLADPTAPADRRVGLLDTLVAGKVGAVTGRLLGAAVRMPRGRALDQVAGELADLAAARRDRYVAHVTAPAALTAEQEERLAGALSRVYGQAISLQVELDPDLLGGLVVRVGEEIIDGSVSGRLDRARQRLAGG